MDIAVATRNLYRFEEKIYAHSDNFQQAGVTTLRSMKQLRLALDFIWSKYGGFDNGRDFPKPILIASPGEWYGGRYLSYSIHGEIHLVRNQRNYLTLVHELSHALGNDYHDRTFVDLEFDILEDVFNVDRGELEMAAGLCGVAR